jgi:hypothetical protein
MLPEAARPIVSPFPYTPREESKQLIYLKS